MFRVLVLGGIALVAVENACGGQTQPADGGTDAAQNPDTFPSELPVMAEAGPPDASDDADAADAFPSELPVQVDP